MGYLRFLVENRLFLLGGFILSFSSSYGQTFFIELFAGELLREFGLPAGQWGGRDCRRILDSTANDMRKIAGSAPSVLADLGQLRLRYAAS